MTDFDDSDIEDAAEDVLDERALRYQRFIALGGNVPLQQELRNLKRLQHGESVTLKDRVTDQHRQLVADMAAGGSSHRTIAAILGIDKTTLVALFEHELDTSFDMAKANLSRNMYLMGMAGDVRAMTNWLRYHSHSDWGSRVKVEQTGKDGGPMEIEHKGKSLEEAKTWMQSVVSAMMVDGDLKGKEPQKVIIPGKDQKATAPAAVKTRKIIKKPREEDDDEETEQ